MDVIEKLNALRLEQNLSVYRLAELSGINQSTLANSFSRKTVPSIKHLEMLCDTLGVTLSQFFTEDETLIKLTPDEIKFMKNYRRLPQNVRHAMSDMVNGIAEIRS